MTATATTTSPGSRRSYRLATSISIALFLASGLLGLAGSPASALPPNPCLPEPQILSFTAAASLIDQGTSTRLNWLIDAPDGCQVDVVIRAVPLNWDSVIWQKRVQAQSQVRQRLQVQPTFDTQYVLTLWWGDRGYITYPTTPTVAVRLPIDPMRRCSKAGCFNYIPDCSAFEPCHHTITIDDNSLAPLLVQALGTPNTTVNVKDKVELDLSPYFGGPIGIKEGVELLGERVARPGTPYQPGPLLFVTHHLVWGDCNSPNPCNWPDPLFRIEGDNVRFSGVRLRGPGKVPDAWTAVIYRPQCPESPDGNGKPCAQGYTTGIEVGNQYRLFHPINVEIDHNEFSNWNNQAVIIGCDGRVPDAENPNPPACPDPRDHRDGTDQGRIWVNFTSKVTSDSSRINYPSVSEPIYVHDNWFHDNFFGEPYFGYGVNVGGSHALIERNVFDGHHHAIAGGNHHHTGYRAYRNLVLGPYDKYNQQFDMHGDRKCGWDLDWGQFDNPGECGLAGHDVDIRWNSFLSTYRGLFGPAPSIKVRGTPSLVWEFGQPVGAVVKSNVFAYDDLRDAVQMHGRGISIGSGKSFWDQDQPLPDHNRLNGPSDLALGWLLGYWSDACDFDGDGKPDSLFTSGQTWWFKSLDTEKGPTPWVYLTTSTLLVSDVVLVPSKSGACDIYERAK
jgi:hypothetical protein